LTDVSVLLLCSGNENLYWMTTDERQQLRIDVGDFEGSARYAEYDYFIVDSEQTKYRLDSLGSYHGTAGQYDAETWRDLGCNR